MVRRQQNEENATIFRENSSYQTIKCEIQAKKGDEAGKRMDKERNSERQRSYRNRLRP